MDESGEERFYRAVQEGDLAWIYSHPAPAPVDLDRVASIYLACPHSGMYAALANRHVPVRWKTAPHDATPAHVCHGHEFTDAVLRESIGAASFEDMLCAFDIGRPDHILRLVAIANPMERYFVWGEFFDAFPDYAKECCKSGKCNEFSERLDQLIGTLDKPALERAALECGWSRFMCCDADRSARRLTYLLQNADVRVPLSSGETDACIAALRYHLENQVEQIEKLARFVFLLAWDGTFNLCHLKRAMTRNPLDNQVMDRFRAMYKKAMVDIVAVYLPVEGIPEILFDYVNSTGLRLPKQGPNLRG